jgi:hypothetical protein
VNSEQSRVRSGLPGLLRVPHIMTAPPATSRIVPAIHAGHLCHVVGCSETLYRMQVEYGCLLNWGYALLLRSVRIVSGAMQSTVRFVPLGVVDLPL